MEKCAKRKYSIKTDLSLQFTNQHMFSYISFILNKKINTELNDFRIIICLRKSEVSVESTSVCNVIEKMAQHGKLYARA